MPVRPDHLAQRDKSALGRVAIVAASFTPRYEFEALTKGKGDAAARSAGRAAIQCAELLKGGGNPITAMLILVCLPVSAAAGALYGASTAVSSEEVDTAKARLQHAIKALRLQEQTAKEALAYGATMGLAFHAGGSTGPSAPDEVRRYDDVRGKADSVIEVAVQKIKVISTGQRDQAAVIWVEAQVRVVDARDGRLVDSLLVKEASSVRTIDAWLRDDGAAIGAALERASASIAEQAIDEILLIYHPASLSAEAGAPSASSGTERVPPYALRALEPPIRNKIYFKGPMTYGHLERYPLDGLQPHFRWEPWPRGFDIAPGSGPGQAQGVSYDFRLFSDDGTVYERRGLPLPEHMLETPLQPCQAYRWTVRARFSLAGSPRATEWMGAYNTMAGTVAPWWWRRGSGVPALYLVPSSVLAFYPIIQTPALPDATCPGD